MQRHGNSQTGDQELAKPEGWPRVAIVILNWNGWQDTIECLESLQHLTYSNYQMILVDNGSTNDSVKRIRDWCEGIIPVNTNFVKFSPEFKPVRYIEYGKARVEAGGVVSNEEAIKKYPSNRRMIIIQTGENLGFTGGNNVAMRYVLGQDYNYIWLLNNDTVVDKDTLTEMVKVTESDKKIGIAGSKILIYEKPDVIQSVGNNKTIWPLFCKIQRNVSAEKYVQAKWLSGSSLLIKREVIGQIGMLDEKYFLYWEEKDFCIRAGQRGWKIYCVLYSRVWHKGGASTESERIEKYFLGSKVIRLTWKSFYMPAYYESRNGIYFVKKNYPIHLMPYIIFRTVHLLFQILLYDDYKVRRMIVILKGAWDGLIGKMGKTIDPSRFKQ